MTKAKTEQEKWDERIMPEPNSGCWLWLRYYNAAGYGQTRIGGRAGYNILAHRLAWERARGPIPINMQVLHRCDNPACVNIEHLFIGTVADNMADKTKKGRWNVNKKRFLLGAPWIAEGVSRSTWWRRNRRLPRVYSL